MNNILDVLAGDVNISNKERIISVAGGLALVVTGLVIMKKKPAASWPQIATGALLLLRGATGHCAVSQAIGRNTAAKEITKEAEKNFDALAG